MIAILVLLLTLAGRSEVKPLCDPITEIDIAKMPDQASGESSVLEMRRVTLHAFSGRTREVTDFTPLDDWQARIGTDIETYRGGMMVVR